MRIVIVTHSLMRLGGLETYIERLAAELKSRGHTIALWCEQTVETGRKNITLPDESPIWEISHADRRKAASVLWDWRPDAVLVQGLEDPGLESLLHRTRPPGARTRIYFFAHAYHGACISGKKFFHSDGPHPCRETLGWKCLLRYYPRREGGRSPVTLMKLYRQQTRRLRLLRDYDRIIVFSKHMATEYSRYQFPDAHVLTLPHGVISALVSAPPLLPPSSENRIRLVFCGRMETVKGGGHLLRSLARLQLRLGREIQVTFIGDGPERSNWERFARTLERDEPSLSIRFTGWLTEAELGQDWAHHDLLVVPSLWPEPFGSVGPEAGAHGLPAVAYAVGGISEWLEHGINGMLAPGDPARPDDLADAIAACFASPETYRGLREGAIRLSQRFTIERHTESLLALVKNDPKDFRGGVG